MYYQVWHKNTQVLDVTKEGVFVLCKDKLPFDLRHYEKIGYHEFLQWMTRRISTLSRTYMNQLYKQRRIGRGHTEIINDSAAISPIDLFWITRVDLSHTWDSLQILRDVSLSTAKASLEGVIDPKVMFGAKDDHTSIFSTKGAFPKAILNGSLLKKGSNAEYEVAGFLIGSYLGIDVARATIQSDGIVNCELFTNDKYGLAHALEVLYPFEVETYTGVYKDALAKFKKNEKISKQLQRLFIFSYLIQNNDLHGENFGFLYDNDTFEILEVAPAYDFNAAFETWDGIDMYDKYIFSNLESFMSNNADLCHRLLAIDEILAECAMLSVLQKTRIVERADYLCSFSETCSS